MKQRRMTIEELKELKPTTENPIVLECDDGFYTEKYSKITIIGIFNNMVIYTDKNKIIYHDSYSSIFLAHYPSFKKEAVTVTKDVYAILDFNDNLCSIKKETPYALGDLYRCIKAKLTYEVEE